MALAAGVGVVLALVGAAVVFKMMSGGGGGESQPTPAPPKQEQPQPAVETPPVIPEPPPVGAQPPAVAQQARGTVLVSIAEPGFTMTLNTRPFTAFAAKGPGQYQLNLPVGKYTIAVQKAGFRADPESFPFTVVEGRSTSVNFTLAPIGPARWTIQGARPGTEVWLVGGRRLGVADGSGHLNGADLPEGTHDIEYRLKGHHPKRGLLTIANGKEAAAKAPDLEKVEVLLQLQGVEPKNASLSIQQTISDLRYDGPAALSPMPAQIKLPPGAYNLTFSAPGYETDTINIQLKDYPLAPKLKLRKK